MNSSSTIQVSGLDELYALLCEKVSRLGACGSETSSKLLRRLQEVRSLLELRMTHLETGRCEALSRGDVTTPSHFFVDYSRERERLRLEGAVPTSACSSAVAANPSPHGPRCPSASWVSKEYEEHAIYRAGDKQ